MSYLKSTVAYLQTLDVITLALLPTFIGIVMAEELDPTEQEVLGGFLADIGETLTNISALIDAQKQLQDKKQDNVKTNESADTTRILQEEQEKMQQQIVALQMQNQEMQGTIKELQNRK